MANINYLLYESAAGYAVFEVVNQADSIGLQLKEVQNSLNSLSTFGKHVKLVSFAPYQYVCVPEGEAPMGARGDFSLLT